MFAWQRCASIRASCPNLRGLNLMLVSCVPYCSFDSAAKSNQLVIKRNAVHCEPALHPDMAHRLACELSASVFS